MSTDREFDLPVLAGRWQFDPDDTPGRGGSAETFGGIDLETGNEIVVKLFREPAGRHGRERFLREAKLHAKLDDDTILRLLDSGRDPEYGDFIVTRRLRPGSLWVVAEGRFPLSTSETLGIGLRIAKALSYMHGRGEIHGDISPGNVLLDANGTAYLADFGFSKRVESVPIASSGEKFGTPGFTAPRKLGTARTHADDVYGLAAVLWFCLTGNPPLNLATLRRRELRNRALRAPLERVLDWDPERSPDATAFAKTLRADWANATEDWRLAASRRQRSQKAVAIATAVVAIVAAGVVGHVFASQPAHGDETVVDRRGVELHLAGGWLPRPAPSVPAFQLRDPVAAARGRTTVVAGRVPTAGTNLIPASARATLPPSARRPAALTIGERAALLYGPAVRFGGAIEILAMPLERDALVIRCSGPVRALSSICAQAAHDIELDHGAILPLAPNTALASSLRVAVKHLDLRRRQLLARLAASTAPRPAAVAARKIKRLEGDFAAHLHATETNAQDWPAIEATVRSTREAATAYGNLANATAEDWSTIRATVVLRESHLARSVRRLGNLKVFNMRTKTKAHGQ
ncbi:MAG TPA: serine/threonine-protein kinase [Solirubrobacterales bacterium]